VCRESEQRDGQGRTGDGLLRWTRGRFTLRRSRRRHTTRLVGLTPINAQRLSAVALVAASPERRVWLVWLSPYEHSYCNELLYEWVCLLPASYTRDDIDITTPLHSAHSILRPRAWRRLVPLGITHFMHCRHKTADLKVQANHDLPICSH
jgi:hypothetical protein